MEKSVKQMPPLMILCGGRGTRLRDVTELLPKPMVPVGEQPIVWHIMKSYAAFGVRRFILCLGYKREAFIDYFMNYHMRTSDSTIKLGHAPEITFHGETEESDWQVTLAGTGLDTMTGGRVRCAAKYLEESDQDFFLTYGDGLADVNIDELYAAHRKNGKLITISAVRPEARFGKLSFDGDTVTGFQEKSPLDENYINGGFMVVKKEFIDRYIPVDRDVFLEREPMNNAVNARDMGVYLHNGFWQCMDNQREYIMLNELWNSGKAPWTIHWKNY